MTAMSVSRRRLLQTGAVVGTGLVIGIALPGAADAGTSTETGRLNAWLRIAPDDTVTVALGQSEMGQGTYTAVPMIVAEELECAWSQVRVERPPANAVYANPAFKIQGTGGSSSIRSFFTPLSMAGASAREMLREAAARRWKAPVGECVASAGAIVHQPTGRKLRYGALAEMANRLPPPKDVALKAPGDWKIVGTHIPRLDTPAKVDGSAVFGADVVVPGMLVGTVIASPVFGGTLKAVDDKPALAIPGVHAVVKLPEALVVLGDGYWPARRGADALRPEWDGGKFAAYSSERLTADLELKLRQRQAGGVVSSVGDAAGAFEAAGRKLEAVYQVPYLAHVTMEPMNATVKPGPDGVEAWLPTQLPGLHQLVLAKIFEVPLEKVIVHTTFLGGGFGRRGEMDFLLYAALPAKITGRPVKVIWSREEDIQHDFYRPAAMGRLQAGLDASGMPTSFNLRLALQSIGARMAAAAGGATLTGDAAGVDQMVSDGIPRLKYKFPNMYSDYVRQDEGAPVGPWRSVAVTHNAFFVESFIDEIAHAGGQDPLALRQKLLADEPRHLAVLNAVAKAAAWGKALPAGHGQGLAMFEFGGTLVAEVAEVSVEKGKGLRVHKVTAAIDCGRAVNPNGVIAQVQGSVQDALSAALYGEVTLRGGRVVQTNFDSYPMLRLAQAPDVEVLILDSGAPLGGSGEPAIAPLAPAIANAIFAATGERIRRLPLVKNGFRAAASV